MSKKYIVSQTGNTKRLHSLGWNICSEAWKLKVTLTLRNKRTSAPTPGLPVDIFILYLLERHWARQHHSSSRANFPIRKRNGSKAAWPELLKFVSSNRPGLWRQRVDLWALQTEKWQNEEIFTSPCPHRLRQGKDQSIPAGTEGFWSYSITVRSQKDAAESGGSCLLNSL